MIREISEKSTRNMSLNLSPQNAGKAVSENSDFKNFPGGMLPDTPNEGALTSSLSLKLGISDIYYNFNNLRCIQLSSRSCQT